MKLLAYKYWVGSALVILVGLWLLMRKSKPAMPTASVELGVGTINDVVGGDYTTPRIVKTETPMEYLIRVSSEAIRADDEREKL